MTHCSGRMFFYWLGKIWTTNNSGYVVWVSLWKNVSDIKYLQPNMLISCNRRIYLMESIIVVMNDSNEKLFPSSRLPWYIYQRIHNSPPRINSLLFTKKNLSITYDMLGLICHEIKKGFIFQPSPNCVNRSKLMGFYSESIMVIKNNNKETLSSPNNRWSWNITHDIHDSPL